MPTTLSSGLREEHTTTLPEGTMEEAWGRATWKSGGEKERALAAQPLSGSQVGQGRR
jgi:hypothetical protein